MESEIILKYARVSIIIKRLAGRLEIVESPGADVTILGITGTQVDSDLVYVIGESVEELMDFYIGMLYKMPLINNHPFISNIAEKLIISDLFTNYFPTQLESSESPSPNYASVLRQQALDEFQILFEGTGIFVPGANSVSANIQNDETRQQMSVKPIILSGEIVKKYIGYDTDEDGISDTDLFKLNSNVLPSFYTEGELEKLTDNNYDVINNIRVKPRYNTKYNKEEISFY